MGQGAVVVACPQSTGANKPARRAQLAGQSDQLRRAEQPPLDGAQIFGSGNLPSRFPAYPPPPRTPAADQRLKAVLSAGRVWYTLTEAQNSLLSQHKHRACSSFQHIISITCDSLLLPKLFQDVDSVETLHSKVSSRGGLTTIDLNWHHGHARAAILLFGSLCVKLCCTATLHVRSNQLVEAAQR